MNHNISITYSIMYHFSSQFDKHSAVDLLIKCFLHKVIRDVFSVYWPDPWGTWTRWASTFGTHGELLSVVPTENWQWIAGEFKVLKCLKNASFYWRGASWSLAPENHPKRWPAGVSVFHRVFSVKVNWQKLGCSSWNRWFVAALDDLLLLFYGWYPTTENTGHQPFRRKLGRLFRRPGMWCAVCSSRYKESTHYLQLTGSCCRGIFGCLSPTMFILILRFDTY